MNNNQAKRFFENWINPCWILVLVGLIGIQNAESANLYFSAADNSSISSTSNWATSAAGTTPASAAPTSADDLFFNTTANNSANRTVNLASNNRAANSVTFNSSGATTVNRSSTTSTSAHNWTINTGITVGSGAGVVTVATTDQKVVLKLGDVAGAFNLNNNSANAVTFNQTAGLTSSGLNNRTLTVGGSGAGGVNFMGGLENGNLTASLSLRVNNSSTTVRIDAASTYTGGTILDAGTIALGSSTALGAGNLTINGGGIASITSVRTIANNITANGDFKIGGLNKELILDGTLGLGGGNRTISLGNSATVNGVISNGGLSIGGDGSGTIRTMTLVSGANSYSGATTVSSANLLVSGSIASSSGATVGNLGSLTVNGTASGVTVNSGGSLLGSGTVGAVTLNNGSFLKPGNSPGNLTATSAIWNSGATYNWEITSLTGTAGTNWDLFTVSGGLDLSALSSTATFNLTLDSAGALAGFSNSGDYSWTFAKAASITGLASTTEGTDITSLFNIASGNFNGGVGPTNGFKVLVGETTGGYTSLNIVPEPSTPALMGLGMVALLAVRSMRRRLS
jgi:hypothetical protein